ncbi:aspartate/glutamate racemase family protein [uncultured Enterovirga sp.]|uniref:aspartate/glutamate racemase family protein n=1 Tax=uncultured Enterovirga sp. TaxID=2026352 RepID=UPI0035CB39D8
MRLLLINPNTTPEITDLVARHARRILRDEAEITAVTGRFGARYVAGRAAYAVASHAALDACAEHGQGHDAVLLACFGDPGLEALKEISPVPVVGMAEASCHMACLLGRRFAIVTGGERWGPMLQDFVAAQGLSPRIAAIRTVAPSGAAIAGDPDGAMQVLAEACRSCAEKDGADVVVLGGAGLAGLADRVAERAGVPVICSLEAGLRATIAAARLGFGQPPDSVATAASAGVDSVGLSEALTRALAYPQRIASRSP